MPQADGHLPCLLSVTRIRAQNLPSGLRIAAGLGALGRQLAGARGLLRGAVRREDVRTFWTLSVWQAVGAMAGFRNDDPHRTWMGNVEALCDESSYVRLPWPDGALPDWPDAEALLRAQGRFTRMARESDDHKAGRIRVRRRGRVWVVEPTGEGFARD